MAGKIIQTDGKILTIDNQPSLQIGDKLYVVDDRMSTFKKIQKLEKDALEGVYDNNPEFDYDKEMLTLALGEKAAQELIDMDMGVQSFKNLILFVMSAITGKSFEELEAETRNAERKN